MTYGFCYLFLENLEIKPNNSTPEGEYTFGRMAAAAEIRHGNSVSNP